MAMRKVTRWAVRYVWQGEAYQTLPAEKEAARAALKEARAKFPQAILVPQRVRVYA